MGTQWGLTVRFQLKEHIAYLFYIFTVVIQYADII